MPDGPGLRLARDYYTEVIGPILAAEGIRHDAGLIGAGSEVLGFDTERSADHDFGARCLIFVSEAEPARCESAHAEDGGVGADSAHIQAARATIEARIPEGFRGFTTRLPRDQGRSSTVVTTVGRWSRAALGVDASMPLSTLDWVGIPTQLLAEATAGAVFHEDLGALSAMRHQLAFYPDDLWRYALTGQWRRIGQEEHLLERTGEVGDDLGSALLAGRLVRDLVRLTLLLRRHYPPYAKWLGSAFARLPDAAALGPALTGALHAVRWQEREEHLCHAYAYLAVLTNETGLAEPLEPTVRGFYDRPFRVIGGDRFAAALTAAITDPAVATLPPVGTVDAFVDSTDVLARADRSRAVTHALATVAP